MSQNNALYTYRNGERVDLEKLPDQFVIRAKPPLVKEMGWDEIERVSPSSTRVTTTTANLEAMMSLARYTAPTHHAYVYKETREDFLITDRILITFKEGTSISAMDSFAGKYALIKKQQYSSRDFLFQLTDHTGMNPLKLIVLLTEEEPLVEIAEHDLNKRLEKYDLELPADPYYFKQWHLHQHYNHRHFDIRSSSRCEEAWQLLGHFGSPEVVVGFSDDGCLLDHPDFDSGNKFAGWAYFQGSRLITNQDFDAVAGNMYQKGANHGTSVAGVIAGEVDATHTVGSAPGVKLLPVKWESEGPVLEISDSKLLNALNFVADKVDIFSNSWGSAPFNLWSEQVVRRIRELAERGGRRGKGILFLWAAGNNNCPVNHRSEVDVPYSNGMEYRRDGSVSWVGVRTSKAFRNNLAGLPALLHVAALASPAIRSHYSNYGTGIDLCAPSNNVHTYGRLTVKGLDVVTATGQQSGVTLEFGGTSSATPLAAGIAALVISANPFLSAEEVAGLLCRTASKDLSLDGYPNTPPASFDPDTSWDVSPVPPFDRGDFQDNGSPYGPWSPWFGFGKVDALSAVSYALDQVPKADETTAFQAVSSPGIAIPDNDPDGLTDTIQCPHEGQLTTLRLRVDIEHTFRGDLVVTLFAPSGKSVVLHNRNGGSGNHLKTTFDSNSLPPLHILTGEQVRGDWKLLVQDLALVDKGTFHQWELDLQFEHREIIALQDAPGLLIPDKDQAGLERTLPAAGGGVLKDLEIHLDITHTYIGDLVVSLTPPWGGPVFLHDRSGGSTDNLIRIYTLKNFPDLQHWVGRPVNGLWKMKVMDHVYGDRGKWNTWALKIVTV